MKGGLLVLQVCEACDFVEDLDASRRREGMALLCLQRVRASTEMKCFYVAFLPFLRGTIWRDLIGTSHVSICQLWFSFLELDRWQMGPRGVCCSTTRPTDRPSVVPNLP